MCIRDRSHINHEDIVISRAWEQFFWQKERDAEAAALAEAGAAAASDGGGASAGGDNAFGVPQYLLDRTKSALERFGVER